MQGKGKIDKEISSLSDNVNGVIRIEVEGEHREIWDALKTCLLDFIRDFGKIVIDKKRQTTISDEMRDYLAEISQAGKAFLKQYSLKNAHIEADTIVKLREAERIVAETRKTNAEARKIEIDVEREDFNWALEKLQALVNLGMVFIKSHDDNEEMMLFLKAAEYQLRIIKGGLSNQRSLTNT